MWKKHISGCFASRCTAWQVRDRSQESHLHSITHCWKWDTTKTKADADGREKNMMAESSEPNSAAERVVWTLSKLKSPVWKYIGFWSVDGKNAEPGDEVVCKQCKPQIANHSTTSNMRAQLENVHTIMSGTATEQPCLHSFFSPPATSSLSAAHQEAARRNLLRLYAWTWGWSVSLEAWASERYSNLCVFFRANIQMWFWSIHTQTSHHYCDTEENFKTGCFSAGCADVRSVCAKTY